MNKTSILLCLLALSIAFVSILITIDTSKAANFVGPNYKNVTVRTQVNITNSKPEILGLVVYQETNMSVKNITLSAGSLRNVTCNATVRDWNGYGDIVNVNATLFDMRNQSDNSDDNNTHYTNYNCTNTLNGNGTNVNYICTFPVYYYANNGTWNCTVIAVDTYNKTGNKSNSTYLFPVYALNVTDGIDYGNVATEDFSPNKTANITNYGNMGINISLEGYGVNRNDGLAMNCSINGNITVNNEHFGVQDVDYATMTALTTTAANISGLTMPKQTVPGSQIINATYWVLYINSTSNPAGNCSGNVIFQANAA